MDTKPKELNRLVSLTFDENPEVRLKAASELEKIDDPAALFALVELSYDKEIMVKEAAMAILEGKRKKERELLSFAEIFSAGARKKEPVEGKVQQRDNREKVLSPITSIFERKFGKEKAAQVKTKMMPAIEKIYQKSVNIEEGDNESGRKAMQEFLTSYLEAVSDIDSIDGAVSERAGVGSEYAEPVAKAAAGQDGSKMPQFEIHEELSGQLEVVGHDNKKTAMLSIGIQEIEQSECAEEKEVRVLDKLPDTIFKRAYEVMMLSGGDEGLMRREMKRLTKNMENDLRLAYSLAKRKFKETNITHLTKLKGSMRNVNTDVLQICEVEHAEYLKPKRQKAMLTRALVKDEEENEGVIYLFDGRGLSLKTSMKLKVVHGMVKTFGSPAETALTVGKKGNIYIVL